MKIVINACYGGFGLSHLAVMRYGELAGMTLYCYNTDNEQPERYIHDPEDGYPPYATYSKKDLGDFPTYDELYAKDNILHYRGIDRNDPLLVQVVEEMGKQANTFASNLKVVEIPDDVEWTIDEYDGLECVDERHRSWS